MTPLKTLICCCCGADTIGRQWPNRDTGYGLCTKCAKWMEPATPPEELERLYGKKGVHYGVVA